MKTKRLMAFIILLVVATKFKVFILDKVYAAQNNNKNQNDKQMIKNIEDIKNNIDNLTKTKFVEEVDANELKKNFDNKLKMNKYVFKNGQIFYCNVLPHMTTTSDVNFFCSEDTRFYITKDDKIFDYSEEKAISEEGYYKISILSCKMDSKEEFKTYITSFNFRIIKNKTNNLKILNIPFECELKNAYEICEYGNENLLIKNHRFFKIDKDGTYRFIIKDKKTNIEYEDIFTIDCTEPFIKLEGLNTYGTTNKCVTATIEDKECLVTIYKNNKKIYKKIGKYSNTFFDTGRYEIIAIDASGNQSNADFIIKYEIKLNCYHFFGIFALIATLGSTIYVRLKQKAEIR